MSNEVGADFSKNGEWAEITFEPSTAKTNGFMITFDITSKDVKS
jgi:hypothetical protein